jgi:hypothetical protein
MYEPRLIYRCDDPDCCENGCPSVTCLYCSEPWPCPEYVSAHTPAQVNAQRRWVVRTWWRGDGEMVRWMYRRLGICALDSES